MKGNLKLLVYTALMAAFVFITTSIIQIPIPFTNGYIHAGDMCIFIAGILLGPLYGGAAAGIGSAMADFLGGYGHWVIPTLIIKTIMGMLIGYFAKSSTNTKPYVVGTIAIWMTSLIAFVYTLGNSSVAFLTKEVEEVAKATNALTFIATVKTQLLAVSIGLPVLILLLWLLKKKYQVSFNQLVGMVISGIWMVMGYYVASALMYGSWVAPIFSIPWNIVQFSIGAVLAFIVIAALSKANITSKSLLTTHK